MQLQMSQGSVSSKSLHEVSTSLFVLEQVIYYKSIYSEKQGWLHSLRAISAAVRISKSPVVPFLP